MLLSAWRLFKRRLLLLPFSKLITGRTNLFTRSSHISSNVLGVPPTLEVMAATHRESLRSLQPKGPYILGGFCNGAMIAYEMARQLHAEGETVDLLILIDPSLIGS